jgi:hypothetical protein
MQGKAESGTTYGVLRTYSFCVLNAEPGGRCSVADLTGRQTTIHAIPLQPTSEVQGA